MNKWQRISHELRALSLPEAGRLLLLRITRPWLHRRAEARAHQQLAAFQNDLQSALLPGTEVAAFLETKFTQLNGFPISLAERQSVAALIRDRFPAWRDRCLERAEQICRNEVFILGRLFPLGEKIDWRKDVCSGASWPFGPRTGTDIGPDIKFIWELSRFHQGVTLGRAYALTGDERFAQKFVELFLDWQKTESQGRGPNWDCPMEVAIRAVNLIWASALVAPSPAFTPEVKKLLVASLLGHAAFIYNLREYDERVVGRALLPVNGNHYLSNLAGLLYISCAFPECRDSATWRDFALKQFHRELEYQVDGDGVNWEYSPNYHRLVLEMILASLALLERNGIPTSPAIREKVVRMLDFLQHYRTPSGHASRVRDIDNGRFCVLGADELDRHDHLLSVGRNLFPDDRLASMPLFEDSLWYLGGRVSKADLQPRMQKEEETLVLGSRLFRESGFCVMRHEGLHLLAVCCAKGMRGYCGHTHNDLLSFELEAYGRPMLIDSGSFVYSQSAAWRNRFRSTASHNTLMVDGAEQNAVPSHELFEIGSTAKPVVRSWHSDKRRDVLDADYSVLLSDGSQVTHSRRFVFLKEYGVWLLRDKVTGRGEHRIETRFHLAPEMDIAPSETGTFRASFQNGPSLEILQLGQSPQEHRIDQGWVSSIYAQRSPLSVLVLSGVFSLPYAQWFVLNPLPSASSVSKLQPMEWQKRIEEESLNGSLD